MSCLCTLYHSVKGGFFWIRWFLISNLHETHRVSSYSTIAFLRKGNKGLGVYLFVRYTQYCETNLPICEIKRNLSVSFSPLKCFNPKILEQLFFTSFITVLLLLPPQPLCLNGLNTYEIPTIL